MTSRLAVLVCLAACGPSARFVVPASRGMAIATIDLELSQAHVALGERALLVDTGTPGSLRRLVAGLRELGVSLGDVRCAVITHAHADHAGAARALQRRGIRIIAGAGDVERMARGRHGKHSPTGVFARMLSWILPDRYAPFVPDVVVTDRLDLADCGIAGEAVVVGGHTPGSLVVLVAGGKIAFAGDLLRGGIFATRSPTVHFFQDDKALAHRRIRELLARGVELFVLGHYGPVTRARVERSFGR